jgi:hypothetical protein
VLNRVEAHLPCARHERDDRRALAALSQGLFREINERIDELGELWAGDQTGQYVCECLETTCTEIVRGLSRDEYHQIRCEASEFVVLPGHERLDVEEVVDRHPRWLVVRKIGTGAEVADHLPADAHNRARERQHVR